MLQNHLVLVTLQDLCRFHLSHHHLQEHWRVHRRLQRPTRENGDPYRQSQRPHRRSTFRVRISQCQEEDPQEAIHRVATSNNLHYHLQGEHHHGSQSGGAGQPGGHPGAPSGRQPIHQARRPIDPWTPLDRSRKSLPQFKLPSNHKSRSILDMRADALRLVQ